MVRKLILLPIIFCIALMPSALAQWLENGVPQADKPYAKTNGNFGVKLVFTDKPDELFEEWNKDTVGVKTNFVDEVKQDTQFTALVIFSNCTPDKSGKANVTMQFTILDPIGDLVGKTKDLEVWVNRPAPSKGVLELSVDFLKFTPQVPGFYTVKALVRDNNSNVEIELERKCRVIEDKKNSKFAWVKIISRPWVKNNTELPENTKGFRHMAILSDILPHGVWEMGPDKNGKIVTTNTVKDLSSWQVHLITQKCIELGGDYIEASYIAVNKQGLIKMIESYEMLWVGEKYIRSNYNENYAVETVIGGAGGSISKAKNTPPDCDHLP